MSKIMQNLVVFMEPCEDTYETPLKTGNIILNRFCIDEDAAFEFSGVNYLQKPPYALRQAERNAKGKDYSFLRSETFLIQFEELYLHKQLIIPPKRTFR